MSESPLCEGCGDPYARGTGYHVSVSGPEGYGGIRLCGDCVASRTLAEALAAAVRREQALEFVEQAHLEAEQLVRDPSLCRQRLGGDRALFPPRRFCSRTAKHEDGLCTQHHNQAEASARFRER